MALNVDGKVFVSGEEAMLTLISKVDSLETSIKTLQGIVMNGLDNEWMNCAQVAELLQVTSNTVRQWCRLNLLKAQQVGKRGTYRIRRNDVLHFNPKDARKQRFDRFDQVVS